MSSQDAGTSEFWATVQIPDDTDAWDASSYAPGLSELTDRTRWLGQFTSVGNVFPSEQTWGANFTGEGGSAVTAFFVGAGVIGSGSGSGSNPGGFFVGGGPEGAGVVGEGNPVGGGVGLSGLGTGNN